MPKDPNEMHLEDLADMAVFPLLDDIEFPVTPTGDRVMLVQDEPASMMAGLHLPDISDRREIQSGVIASVGDHYKGEAKVGDRVVFDPWRGEEWNLDGFPANLRLCDADEILAIITDD